nr:isoform 2 of ankyrin-2 [Quercus suber]
MDPFSIITIIQLTSQASLKLYDFIQTLREAKGEINALGRDVQGLTTVLQRLERTLSIPKIRAFLETEAELKAEIGSWEDIIKLCHDKVKVLTTILKSCSYYDAPRARPKLSGVKWFFKRTDAYEAQEQLVRTQVTLDNAMTQGVLHILLGRAGVDKPVAPSIDPIAERERQGGQLRSAARNGDNKSISILLEADAPINSRNREGRTALSIAAEQGHVETVRFLLQQKDIAVDSAMEIVAGGRSKASESKRSPLHWAAACGQTAIAGLLLDAGAKMTAQTFSKASESKRTPLHWAAACGQTAIAGLLLDAGAKMTAQTFSQRQPVQEAAMYGHQDTVAYLLGRGADINTKTYFGWSMLHTAASNGRVELAQLMLQHGANTEIAYTGTWHGEGKGENGATHQRPLHYAVRPHRRPTGDETAMIELLVRLGRAKIGATDSLGCTPLHYAVRSKWRPAIQVLLRYARKHEVEVRDRAGKTALQDATAAGDPGIVKMIQTRLNKA